MSFVLSVMHVVGDVTLWVVCLFVSVVHPVAILSAVFCVICSLLMVVSNASVHVHVCISCRYHWCLAVSMYLFPVGIIGCLLCYGYIVVC